MAPAAFAGNFVPESDDMFRVCNGMAEHLRVGAGPQGTRTLAWDISSGRVA